MAATFRSIPVIELGSDREDPALGRELGEICHDIGFFVVVDHGVPTGQIAEVFELMERFFALDDDTKAKIDKSNSPWFRGWEAVGSELTNNRVDVREQIDVWTEWPVADEHPPSPVDRRLLGPNQWLPDEVLHGHRRITQEWMNTLGDLGDDILGLLSLGLGLGVDHFRSLFGDQPMSLVKMIHYPPTPQGAAGVNAHHDTGFLTILAPGPAAGLQVENPDGDWIDVPAIPDSFVVNLGEMLQAMTGNYFIATPHRVIASEDRLSTGYFHGPSLDTPLAQLPLDERYAATVAMSDRHRSGGFMASTAETWAGIADMSSSEHAATYGDQLWRYFARSYPDNMARHHSDVVDV
jgi:isopenicillin N synthase-like dioxygenase